MLSRIRGNRIIRTHNNRVLRDGVFRGRKRDIPRRVLPIRITVLETDIDNPDPISGTDVLSFSISRVKPSNPMFQSRQSRAVPRPTNNNSVVTVLINRDLLVANSVPSSSIGGSGGSRHREVLQHGILGQSFITLAGLGVGGHLSFNNQNIIEAKRERDSQVLGVGVVGKSSVVVGGVVNDTLQRVLDEGSGDTVVGVPEHLREGDGETRSVGGVLRLGNIVKPFFLGITVGVTSLTSAKELHKRGARDFLTAGKHKGDIRETIAISIKGDNASTIVSTVSKVGTDGKVNTVGGGGGAAVEGVNSRGVVGGVSLDNVDRVVAVSHIASIGSPERVLGAFVRDDLVATEEDTVADLAITELVGNGEGQVTGVRVLAFQNEVGLGGKEDVGDVVGGRFVRVKVGFLLLTRTSKITEDETLGPSPDNVSVHVAVVGDHGFAVGHSYRGGDISAHRVGDVMVMDVSIVSLRGQDRLKEKEEKYCSKDHRRKGGSNFYK